MEENMGKLAAVVLILAVQVAQVAHGQQVIPPGQLTIDGVRVGCGQYPTVLSPQLPDVGFFDGQAIYLNPMVLNQLPRPLKLYWYAHECAHGMGIFDEAEADCWAVRLGRSQGWFPPAAFNGLMQIFAGNPGSIRHPPGPMRVQIMMNCYRS
jgi:hypothetical protein